MSKMIIENRSALLDDRDCLHIVSEVMSHGRVSNDGKQYCYVSTFNTANGQVVVYTGVNKKSDRFVVADVKKDKKAP